MQSPGPPDTRPFIADTISNILVGGKDVFIVIHIGGHLYRFDPSMFIQRLYKIREAVLEHHQRFPDTRFIVKGLNVVDNAGFWSWEWSIYRFEIILKTVFKDIANLVFLDLWDFTTVWSLDDIHPTGLVLDQQWFLMKNLMCC